MITGLINSMSFRFLCFHREAHKENLVISLHLVICLLTSMIVIIIDIKFQAANTYALKSIYIRTLHGYFDYYFLAGLTESRGSCCRTQVSVLSV